MREDSGISPGLSSLPEGGGGISALGDRFQPDLIRGSGGYSISINVPKGPNELQPSLNLSYSTGSGNGPFGLGWRLNILRIERRSDRGIPDYTDDDTFVIGDAEMLVPVGANLFRPRTDTKFWKTERVDEGWQIKTGDGKTMRFGQTPASRESSDTRIFAWYLDQETDAAGNSIFYSYTSDDNRLYLKEVNYSIFSVRFIYEARPDIIRNGRSGFGRLTRLRAGKIELHCDRLAPTLMRTYTLSYTQAQNGVSLLVRFSLSASDENNTDNAPPLEFDYSQSNFTNWNVHEIQSLISAPGLDDPGTQLVDMSGDGLPDILQSTGSRMYLWSNRGNGSLTGPVAVEGIPSAVNLARTNVAFADLNGDGRVDLFAVDQPLQLAFSSNGRGGFLDEPIVFQNRPNIRLSAPDTRLMDIDGDGVTDLISAGRDYLLLYRHLAGQGWQDPLPVARIASPDDFPDLRFEDRGVQLSDMTGDGLQDFVLVRSADTSYWPYFGNGVWGKRVIMENPPQFPNGYREDRLQVIDLDGDGCSDIVYFDHDRTLIWLNQSGVSFAAPIEIPVTPNPGNARVLPADFFGDGRMGFLWTAVPTREYSAGYRYLRFDEGHKPYLLTKIRNGLGRETEMEYSTTAVMRLRDEENGEDWPGQLPFIVPVVSSIRDRDMVSGGGTFLSIHYHDGVYDGAEREFRGFNRVTVDMEGDESIPDLRQEYRFFQGDPDLSDLQERERQRAIAGSFLSLQTFAKAGAGFKLLHESAQTWDTRTEFELEGRHVFFPFLSQIENREHSAGGSPQRIERTRFADYDAFGNAGKRICEFFAEGDLPERVIRTEERFVYTKNEQDWLVKLPVRSELRDEKGVPFIVKIHFYDGPSFKGLAEGKADHGLLTCTQELMLLKSRLPADYIGDRNFSVLGYQTAGSGDTQGFYATTLSVQRDGFGNITGQHDPLGALSRITYDADGVYPIEKTDASGKTTKIVFNLLSGEPGRVTLPGGRKFSFQTDLLGRAIAQFESDDTGVEQLVKCWEIDISDIPVSVISFVPVGKGHLLNDFIPAADLTEMNGVYISRAFLDGYGKQALKIASAPDEPGGGRRFVALGQTIINKRKLIIAEFSSRFVPGFDFIPAPSVTKAQLRHAYDAQGNLLETAGPGPAHFRIIRDTFSLTHFEGLSAGEFDTAVPPGPANRVEFFDARDRVIRIEEAKGDGTMITTSYDLSVDGRIAVIRNHSGNELAHYIFAGPGEAVRITHRDAGTRTYYRDAAGRIAELVRADGSRLLYRYDISGRLLRMEHVPLPEANPAVLRELFYDADPGQPGVGRFLEDRVALVREEGNEIRYSYNSAGSVVREESTINAITLITMREYNLRQELTAIIYPDGRRIEYELDASGSLQKIPDVVAAVSYNHEGLTEGYTYTNGVECSFPHDALSGRLSKVSAIRLGNLLRQVSYTYDETGNITGLHDEMPGSDERHVFTCDGLYRLTRFDTAGNNEAGPVVGSQSYAYDAEGNILQTGPDLLDYEDPLHAGRVTSFVKDGERHQISYNDRGAVRSWSGEFSDIEYDPLDRVAGITRSDGTRMIFAYDPQNRRIMKQIINGPENRKVFYASRLFEKHDAHSVRHIYLGNTLVASETVVAATTEFAFYLSDHHGTILLTTDGAGAVVQNQRYAPFGKTLDTAVSLNRYLGIEKDPEMGLLQLGDRFYAPDLGRFISPDWYVLENPTRPMRIPQGFNAYSYALNNPMVFKDPSGKWFFLVPFAVGFVTGLIYGLADGQKWDAFGTALETGLTTGFGAMLGGAVVGSFVSGGGLVGAGMGGINGLFTGLRKTYDWGSIEGWSSFVSDSTWGIIGTSLGNILNIGNLIGAPSSYNSDLSKRQNRQVYDRGFAFGATAFTQGNVMSNLDRGKPGTGAGILKHEQTHNLQNRLFGPIYVISSAAWYAVAGIISVEAFIGPVGWIFTGQKPFDPDSFDIAQDLGHDKSPWEVWAAQYDPPGK